MKTAQITAAALYVLCPECGENQPNPDDGSFLWGDHQVTANSGKRTCSCGAQFRLASRRSVPVG